GWKGGTVQEEIRNKRVGLLSFRILSFGEALWDLLPDESVLGGAPLNFAYRAGTLGSDTSLVSRLGTDELGGRAWAQMKHLGMDVRFIQRDSSRPTGTVKVTFDSARNPDYVILENVAYDFIESTGEMNEAAAGADCICFGSLAQRSSGSRQTLSVLLDHFRGGYVLYDVNLRKKCYSEEIIRASLQKANIVKLNETELAELKGILGLSSDGLQALASELVSAFSLHCLVTTLGSQGAFAVTPDGTAYSRGFNVLVEDTLGSGDAFTAGFIFALLSKKPVAEALTFGNALGALVAGQKGATQETSLEDLHRFMETGKQGPPHPRFG
ncbi:MAG: carbohydrate kinase, partial [Spirochaetales bacterium]